MRYLLLCEAEPALTFLVLGNVSAEMGGAVVGPVLGCHGYFGICCLEKQEIAQAHVAAGADNKVRVGHSGGCQGVGDGGFVDAVDIQLAGHAVGGYLLCRAHYFPS